MRCSVVHPGVAAGVDVDSEIKRIDGQGAVLDCDAIVVSVRARGGCILEGVGCAACVGDACEVAVCERLALYEAAAAYCDVVVGEGVAVISFGSGGGGQCDAAAAHFQGVVTVLGLVVGELGLHFHGFRAHVGEGRYFRAPRAPTPVLVDGAVIDGRRVAVAGRCRGCRLESRAVVRFETVGAARAGQCQTGGVDGDGQGAARRVNAVVGEGGAWTG